MKFVTAFFVMSPNLYSLASFPVRIADDALRQITELVLVVVRHRAHDALDQSLRRVRGEVDGAGVRDGARLQGVQSLLSASRSETLRTRSRATEPWVRTTARNDSRRFLRAIAVREVFAQSRLRSIHASIFTEQHTSTSPDLLILAPASI